MDASAVSLGTLEWVHRHHPRITPGATVMLKFPR